MCFKKGDKVIYIKKCHDHSSNYRLKLQEVYTVKEYHNGSVMLDEVYWWVELDCVKLFEDSNNPYYKVCYKVKQLEDKFNTRKSRENSYAF